MGKKWKNNSYIGIVILYIFAAVAGGVLYSSYYMNKVAREAENAESRRMQYREMGENLAKASDYLTSEVRSFSVTGEWKHLYNYWYEIYETRQRDQALALFEQSNPPEKEEQLLKTAKKNSDLLVRTETISMKLVLLSMEDSKDFQLQDKKLQNYVNQVMDYPLPQKYSKMDKEEMRRSAVTILNDEDYESFKEKIMTPIAQFQSLMNERLNAEVKEKNEQLRQGTWIQILIALINLAAIGILIQMMNRLYIRPLKCAKNEAVMASQAKSIFLAQMTHELRTPLNAVNGYSYLLEQTALNNRQREYVKNIRTSSDGLLELINQILDFSKIDMGHLVFEEISFSIRKMMEDIVGMLSVQAKNRGLYLHLNVDDKIPERIIGDPLRMKQVMVNLIGNALKFTEQGGVDVELQQIGLSENGSCLIHFQVTDTGIGIEKEKQDEIFQAFTQSDASITRKYGGTGLGLPICSQIIEQAGDRTHRLKVKSTPGQGSTFTFDMDFKLSNEMEALPATVRPDADGKKILLVDDNETNLLVLKEMIKLTNAVVFTAQSGRQAIQMLKRQKDICMVFMDIRMPDLDGYETSRMIHSMQEYEKLPIVALTADATPEVKEKAKKAGMVSCLLKPVHQEELFMILGRQAEKTRTGKAKQEQTESLFQKEQCISQLGGNETALLEIVKTFLESHANDAKILQKLLREKKEKEALELLHQLKGVTGNLCCFRLAEECSRFRENLEMENPEFFEVWKHTWAELNAYVEQSRKQEKERSKEDVSECLQQIYTLCEEYDTEAQERMEQISLDEIIGSEMGEKLRKAGRHYNFEEMKKILDETRDRWEE